MRDRVTLLAVFCLCYLHLTRGRHLGRYSYGEQAGDPVRSSYFLWVPSRSVLHTPSFNKYDATSMNYSNQLELSGIYERYSGISSYTSYLSSRLYTCSPRYQQAQAVPLPLFLQKASQTLKRE